MLEKERIKMTEMTKREALKAIANGEMNDELKLWAENEIGKMDKANEARRNKQSKKAAENAPLKEKIVAEILGTEPVTASVVGEKMEMSTQKASALLRQIVEAGQANKVDIKVPGKGTQKGYVLA